MDQEPDLHSDRAEAARREAGRRVPWWMTLIIVACALPGICFPALLTLVPQGEPLLKGLLWFYPFYVLASALLAWQCYGRRTALCWILLILLVLTHVAMFTLVLFVPQIASPF